MVHPVYTGSPWETLSIALIYVLLYLPQPRKFGMIKFNVADVASWYWKQILLIPLHCFVNTHNSKPEWYWLSKVFKGYVSYIPCKCKHFPRDWPFVRGIHRSEVGSLTKASDAGLRSFLWSAPEQKVEQSMRTPVIWDAIAFFMTSSL